MLKKPEDYFNDLAVAKGLVRAFYDVLPGQDFSSKFRSNILDQKSLPSLDGKDFCFTLQIEGNEITEKYSEA